MTLSVLEFKISDTKWSKVTSIVVIDPTEGFCTLEVTSVPAELENDFYTGDPEEDRMTEEEFDEIEALENEIIKEYTEVYTNLSNDEIDEIFKSIKVNLANLHTLSTEDAGFPIDLKSIENLCPRLQNFNNRCSQAYEYLTLSKLI